jgi:ATP-dependent DNA helicase DinG
VSVTAHECVGATRCQYAAECFSERARERARQADVVVTNHAMLAIDAFSGIPLLPEHDVVVVDEAHELVDRATGAVTDELTAADGRAGGAPHPHGTSTRDVRGALDWRPRPWRRRCAKRRPGGSTRRAACCSTRSRRCATSGTWR